MFEKSGHPRYDKAYTLLSSSSLTVIVEGYNSQRSSAGGTAIVFILLVKSLS